MDLNFLHTPATAKNLPTIVLLHGWSGSSKSLVALQEQLSLRGFEVYNLDLPGFGGTKLPPRAFYMDDYLAAVTDFIKEKGINKPLLVGHSFGGKISLKLAAVNSGLVSGIVAIDASGVFPNNSRKKKILGSLAKVGKSIEAVPLFGLFATPAKKLFYKMVVREHDYYNSGALRDTFINIVNEHLDKLLPDINLPVLVIWGAQDKVTPLWMGERLAELIPNAKLEVVPGARHSLPLAKPEIVAEIIYNEIDKQLK